MKRTMIVMLALALLLVWSGMASAQLTNDKCGATYPNHVLTFPYLPGAGADWWQGLAIMNKTNGAVDYDQLCLEFIAFHADPDGDVLPPVYIKDEGYGVELKEISETGKIKRDGIFATLVNSDLLEAGSDKMMVAALYSKTASHAGQMTGYVQFGGEVNGEALGYFALQPSMNVNASDVATSAQAQPEVEGTVYPGVNGTFGSDNAWREVLGFDFIQQKDTDLWRGIALFSPTLAAADTATYRFQAFYAGGDEDYTFDRTLKGNQILVGFLDDFSQIGSAPVQLIVENNSTNGTVGFMMFGNAANGNGMGYLGNMFEVYNSTDYVKIQNYPARPLTP